MAGLSPTADAIKAATERDFAGAKGRLSAALALAQQEVSSRQLDAASARTAGVAGVQAQYGKDRQRIEDRALDLARESGAFQQGRYGELREGQRGRQHESRENRRKRQADAREASRGRENARTVAGVDAGGRVIPGGAKDKPGRGRSGSKVKWSTPLQHGSLKDTIDAAVVVARGLRSDGDDRHRAAQSMVKGEPARTVKVQGPDGTPQSISVPGVPKVSPLAASIALDLVFDRHVSRRNVQELHRRRYQLKRLGYPTGGGSSPYRPSTPPQTPGPSGQQRPN